MCAHGLQRRLQDREMGVSVEEESGMAFRERRVGIDVAMGQKEPFPVVYQLQVIGQDREIQHHLVYFRVAISADGHYLVGHAVQALGNPFRVDSFGYFVTGTVIEDIAQDAKHVTSVLLIKVQHLFKRGKHSVYIGYNQVFHVVGIKGYVSFFRAKDRDSRANKKEDTPFGMSSSKFMRGMDYSSLDQSMAAIRL